MLTYALIGGAVVIGGLLMGKYYGKPPKDEDKDQDKKGE